jgi:hypothetical protein
MKSREGSGKSYIRWELLRRGTDLLLSILLLIVLRVAGRVVGLLAIGA